MAANNTGGKSVHQRMTEMKRDLMNLNSSLFTVKELRDLTYAQPNDTLGQAVIHQLHGKLKSHIKKVGEE